MAHKVSIYLDEHAHRELKAAASRLGQSLSEFMARAALESLRRPTRREAAEAMDRLREQVGSTFTAEEIREMRDAGRA
jgi:uncharacterized protein (DUF1778 family)